MTPMQYEIVKSIDITTLVEKVNSLLEGGWLPLGGVVITTSVYGSIYYQALTKIL